MLTSLCKETFDIAAVGDKKTALLEVKWSELSDREVKREIEKLEEKAKIFGSAQVPFLVPLPKW